MHFYFIVLQKPPKEPQGYQRYRTSGRGAIANQMKKDKTMFINKHVDDHNIIGIAQVSIRDRFCPCLILLYFIVITYLFRLF